MTCLKTTMLVELVGNLVVFLRIGASQSFLFGGG
jgi:hypothetical protein